MKNNEQPLGKEKPNIIDKENNVVKAGKNAATSLKELFVDALKDIYWAENALVKTLPKMAANASSPNLKSGIVDHHTITINQVERLKEVFNLNGETAQGKKCEAIEGIIKEGDDMLQETALGPVRDAAIIASSQKIEHYEIAAYGTLHTFAKVLGENDAAKLLQQSLAEEKESDKILTDVANVSVNMKAD